MVVLSSLHQYLCDTNESIDLLFLLLGRQYVAVGSTLVNQKPPTIRYRRTGVKNKILYFAVLRFEIKINRQPVCWAESSGSCLSTSVVSSVSSSPPSYFKTLYPGSDIYCNICWYIIKCYSKRDSEKNIVIFHSGESYFPKRSEMHFLFWLNPFIIFCHQCNLFFHSIWGSFNPRMENSAFYAVPLL